MDLCHFWGFHQQILIFAQYGIFNKKCLQFTQGKSALFPNQAVKYPMHPPVFHWPSLCSNSLNIISDYTAQRGGRALALRADQPGTHPFLVLQAVQHRFPPRVLLWTRLCSSLHLPIGTHSAEYPAVTTTRGQHPQVLKSPSFLGSQSWCMNVCAKIGRVVCLSALLHANSNTRSL